MDGLCIGEKLVGQGAEVGRGAFSLGQEGLVSLQLGAERLWEKALCV